MVGGCRVQKLADEDSEADPVVRYVATWHGRVGFKWFVWGPPGADVRGRCDDCAQRNLLARAGIGRRKTRGSFLRSSSWCDVLAAVVRQGSPVNAQHRSRPRRQRRRRGWLRTGQLTLL